MNQVGGGDRREGVGGWVRGSIGGKGIEVWAQLHTEDIEVNPNCMTHREMNKITNPSLFQSVTTGRRTKEKKLKKNLNKEKKATKKKRRKKTKNYKYIAQSHTT